MDAYDTSHAVDMFLCYGILRIALDGLHRHTDIHSSLSVYLSLAYILRTTLLIGVAPLLMTALRKISREFYVFLCFIIMQFS